MNYYPSLQVSATAKLLGGTEPGKLFHPQTQGQGTAMTFLFSKVFSEILNNAKQSLEDVVIILKFCNAVFPDVTHPSLIISLLSENENVIS